jgi:PAS domain S-box-containing protein
MPQFSSLAALKLCREHDANIPFIVVSGSIGEELAVTAMKAGADDYVMKDNLTRLVPAVERELREAESRRRRRGAEQALDQCRRRTDSILEAAGEGICGLDANGLINFINPRGAKLVGWEAGELIGKPLHETLHHSRADRKPFLKEDCSLCATLRDGLAHWMDNEVFWRKDGLSFPAEYTCVPMREGDQVVGAVLTFQDITERRGSEAALREANRRLENTVAELRRTHVGRERLPAHLGQPARLPVAKATDISKNGRLHILVVEDDPMVRNIEAEYLISDGHAVETADGGCEGLSKFRAGKYDLVVTDRAMPEINGDQLTEAIKETDPDMPVILVTGFAETLGDGHNRVQANLVLCKPFSRVSLLEAVGRAVLSPV